MERALTPTPSRLPTGMTVFERGWLSANNVLLVDGDDAVLVDSGYTTHADQTVALVAHALGGRRLARLVNTHLHSDHCGGNASLQRRWQPRTSIPAAEADAVLAWDADALSFRATGQQCERFTFDDLLNDGDMTTMGGIDWHVIGAPGHDPHAVMLHAPGERILIVGDALWENGFGVIFPELDGESGFSEQGAVLERIAGLDVGLVIPGHGRPFAEVDAALERARSRLAYLSADPRRNAAQGLRVLAKFKLLEEGRMSCDALLAWMKMAPLFERVRTRHLDGQSMAALRDEIVAGLCKAGAAVREGDNVVDA